MATFTSPSRQGRPKVSETITAKRVRKLLSRQLRRRRAEASGSFGKRVTSPAAELDRSTPALAQTNP